MKKLIVIILLILIATTNTNAKPSTPKLPAGMYPTAGVVCSVQQQGKSVYKITFVDACGRKFAWLSQDGDWEIGDMISAVMYNAGTIGIVYDDIIVGSPLYVGSVDMLQRQLLLVLARRR